MLTWYTLLLDTAKICKEKFTICERLLNKRKYEKSKDIYVYISVLMITNSLWMIKFKHCQKPPFLNSGYDLLKRCSYKMLRKFSWKIWSVIMVFFSSGKTYVLCYVMLCNVMCSCGILRKFSKVLVLVPFSVLLGNLMCFYRKIMFSTKKCICFLLLLSLLDNLMCSTTSDVMWVNINLVNT